MNSCEGLVTVYGQELCLAVQSRPDADIYALHQLTWQQVSSHMRFAWTPKMLWRRDGGLVRIRITDGCAVRATPVRATLHAGARMSLDVRLALWRDLSQSHRDPTGRAREMIESHGARVHEIKLRAGIATGYKSRIGADIRLPVAHCVASITVEDPQALARAWSMGIGRGRRFGFGMPVLH